MPVAGALSSVKLSRAMTRAVIWLLLRVAILKKRNKLSTRIPLRITYTSIITRNVVAADIQKMLLRLQTKG